MLARSRSGEHSSSVTVASVHSPPRVTGTVVMRAAALSERLTARDLLSKLRAQRAIQVAIETRFLTVTSNYLEEMGIDLDIVLNQGNAGFDPAQQTVNPLAQT